jgi:uncharacterized protein (TIGR00369 family)
MENLNDDNMCFVCGTANPQGLKLKFHHNEETGQVESNVTFPIHLQGWKGVVHGGLVSTILDEVMVKAAAKKKLKCVTGEITVKFKKPTLTNQEYILRGKIVEIRKRIIFTEGFLLDRDEKVIASAKGKLFSFE